MTDPRPGIVFDTGPLRHFALQSWLGVLKHICRDYEVFIPETVEAELKDQSRTDTVLSQVLEADWITVDRSVDLAYLQAFATFERQLAVGSRNRGECGVLALGKVRGYQMVVDDRVAYNLAHGSGLACRRTLGLLVEAIHENRLTTDLVSDLADDLISGAYHLPFPPGGFAQWAKENGLP